MKLDLVQKNILLKDDAEAHRLQLLGSRGYPESDNMTVLAEMHSITIE